ncbi:hypothetical protein KFU94_16175 [Chloroflexi bacterium TSY]|nr:hypothetical protein [Chloroflexi bacterium TSY]
MTETMANTVMAESRTALTLNEEGHTFRDLNKNGLLDPYEDSRLPIDA